jgi:23S rRNA-/tRNA-specific pseudouridylate synthase
MLARTKALARELSQQFRARAIEKTYLALVLGGSRDFSAKKGLISGSLSFDDGRVQLGTEEESGSKPASDDVGGSRFFSPFILDCDCQYDS